jgi:cyclopropane fatty-acyl-phospholipid synthase-like methyltransferase
MSERKSHQHSGKFTEGLLNSEMVLKALNIKAGQTILDAGCGNGYTSNKKYVDSVFPIGIRASFFQLLQ